MAKVWKLTMGSDDKGGLGLKSMPYPMVEQELVADSHRTLAENLDALGQTRAVLVLEKIDGEAHD